MRRWIVRLLPGQGLRCVPGPDPAAYSGPDSNSTAMAAMALRAAGENQAARAAVRYLRGIQNRDGGFPYYAGGTSDANSTGLTWPPSTVLVPPARSRSSRDPPPDTCGPCSCAAPPPRPNAG